MNRNKIIKKNVSLGLLFKALNMALVYLTIPYILLFLGNESYGVWVTIFSTISVLLFIDAGIANGLKTKLSKSISDKNYQLSRAYISTAYVAIFILATFFFLLGFIILNNIHLSSLLNISSSISESTLKNVFFITLIFVVSNFVLSLYKAFFYAVQKAAVIEISMFLYQALVFLLVFYAFKNMPSSLNYVAYVYGCVSLLIGITFSIIFFSKNKNLRPRLSYFNKEALKDLMNLSLGFFIIQLCMVVIFATDNILISNLLGAQEVANYDVALKLFQVLITLSMIVLEPFWALFSDAYQQKDFQWIKETLLKLNKLFVGLVIAVVGLVFLAKTIIFYWVGDVIHVDQLLIYAMGLFVLVRVYGIIYMYFLNGIGNIKIQMWLYVFGAIVNIPISILFVKYFNLGSSGIIMGTILSIFINTLVLPIQTRLILKNNQ